MTTLLIAAVICAQAHRSYIGIQRVDVKERLVVRRNGTDTTLLETLPREGESVRSLSLNPDGTQVCLRITRMGAVVVNVSSPSTKAELLNRDGYECTGLRWMSKDTLRAVFQKFTITDDGEVSLVDAVVREWTPRTGASRVLGHCKTKEEALTRFLGFRKQPDAVLAPEFRKLFRWYLDQEDLDATFTVVTLPALRTTFTRTLSSVEMYRWGHSFASTWLQTDHSPFPFPAGHGSALMFLQKAGPHTISVTLIANPSPDWRSGGRYFTDADYRHQTESYTTLLFDAKAGTVDAVQGLSAALPLPSR